MAVNQILTPNVEIVQTFEDWRIATNQILEFLRSGAFQPGTTVNPYEIAYFSDSITKDMTIPTNQRGLAIDATVETGVTVTVDGVFVVL